jgi:hypothetical protein
MFVVNLIANSALRRLKFRIAFKILLLFKAKSEKEVFAFVSYITLFRL